MTDSAIISAFETHFPGLNLVTGEVLMNQERNDLPIREASAWELAEDSFLKFFCRVERFDWGSFYFWDAGQDWPKFNFIRLKSAPSSEDFKRLVAKYQPYFAQRGRTFNVRIHREISVEEAIKKGLKRAGIPLVSLQLDPKQMKRRSGDAYLCKNEEDVFQWWEINSDGRSRQDPKKSPLWPVVLNAFRDGTRYYILRKEGQAVAGAALTPFNEGRDFNLWGLATRLAHQKKGYMKELVAAVGNTLTVPFYLQVNQDSVSHQMFKRLGAEELTVESRYEIS